MKTGKVIAGVAIGAVVALILMPRTRKMISDAFCNITDSFKVLVDDAKDVAEQSQHEVNRLADRAKDVAGSLKAAGKDAWQA